MTGPVRLFAGSLAVALAVVGGAACGDDSDPVADYTEAFTTLLQNDDSTSYSAAEAKCAAKPIVEAMTVKTLEAKKITVDDVKAAKSVNSLRLKPSAAVATEIADVVLKCVDVGRNALDEAKKQNKELQPTAQQARCVRRGLKASSDFRDAVRDKIQQGDQFEPSAKDEELVIKTFGKCEVELYTADEYVEAAASQIASEDLEDLEVFSEDDMRCVATKMVEAIGVSELMAEGVTPEMFGDDEFSPKDVVGPAEAEVIANGFTECVDVLELVREVLNASGAFDGLPEEFADCIFDGLAADPAVADAFRDAFVAGLLGDGDAEPDIDMEALGERIGAECAAKLGEDI